MSEQNLKSAVEAMLMSAEQPLGIDRLHKLLDSGTKERPSREAIREAVESLQTEYDDRGIELAEIASGFRFRARAEYADQVGRMFEERRPRYSRAFMETLAIIAYRQPITRGEIEHIRGVAVSTNIMRQLLEREWVKVVGHRDVPGRPAVYATTREFLDYFGLRSLDDMPSLADLRDVDAVNADLFDEMPPADAPSVSPDMVDSPPADADAEAVGDETTSESPDDEPQAQDIAEELPPDAAAAG